MTILAESPHGLRQQSSQHHRRRRELAERHRRQIAEAVLALIARNEGEIKNAKAWLDRHAKGR